MGIVKHTKGDLVKIPRIGLHTQGEYYTIKFSHCGTNSDDSHGFYGYKRHITRDRIYYDRELTFWSV